MYIYINIYLYIYICVYVYICINKNIHVSRTFTSVASVRAQAVSVAHLRPRCAIVFKLTLLVHLKTGNIQKRSRKGANNYRKRSTHPKRCI